MTSALAISVSDDGLALVPEHDQAAATLVPADAASVPQRQFWETEHTRPDFQPSNEAAPELVAATANYLGECMRHPYLPVSEIRARQFARIKELVELAYRDIPVYRAKYDAAGFKPEHLRDYDDIQKIPVITKPELVAAFPDQCVNKKYKPENLFPTRSSGSSGQTLLIRVDYDAVITDTIQGVRQFAMQSGGNYRAEDLLAHVYTVPWWFDSIGGDYPTAFISNLIPPARVAQHLRYLGPKILSLYPSSLDALMPHVDEFRSSLNLAVTHSEYSSRTARAEWSRQLGVPVLDEYSSEEATRIALEMPNGQYHVCEDTVHLDVLDPVTMEPQAAGQSGIAVITNLLNEAMPFIRYVQGDYITQPANPVPSDINWSQIASIDGRLNDAFVNRDGRKVPAGSILDATYRWMFDCNLHLAQFEIVQRGVDLVEARVVLGQDTPMSRLRGSVAHLEDLLAACLEHPVRVQANALLVFPPKVGKRRPIRREID
ncbi:phenylacetate--CoA ligase family protein [Bradyrhizobium sp. Pha-3]|uniref:phenylacetate--CoA ligase family protein n=1 Tax=Bradyrhizobium sp. Pha-3 TaxID=208375 RepID=UPI0035D3F64C